MHSCGRAKINVTAMSHIAGRFGEFGESSVICQTKTIQLVLTINNLLADLLIHQILFCKMLERINSPNFPVIQ